MSNFQTFIESVLHVPTEVERNCKLVTTLDMRVDKTRQTLSTLLEQYRQTKSAKERRRIRKDLDDLEVLLDSLSNDKTQVITQSYELLDKTIDQLTELAPKPDGQVTELMPLGCNMPVDPEEPKWCLCKVVSYGEMVLCDNKDCPIEWFHLGCVGLQVVPKGKWFCPECSSKMTNRHRNRRKRPAR